MVFYGSQTGTAEEFAGRLAKEGLRYNLKGMVADPEESDMVSTLHISLYICNFQIEHRIVSIPFLRLQTSLVDLSYWLLHYDVVSRKNWSI